MISRQFEGIILTIFLPSSSYEGNMQPFDRKCTKISRPSFIVSSMYHERVPKHAKAGLCNNSSSMNFQVSCLHLFLIGLCLVHVIWTKRRMLKLVLNVKYLLLLSFLTVTKFYNLGYIQGIITQKRSYIVLCTMYFQI